MLNKKQGIESLFCTYKIALELKELGFDEPCFGWYQSSRLKIEAHPLNFGDQNYMRKEDCFAPTFSQAFRWFREKYGFIYEVNVYSTSDGYSYSFKILCKKYTPYIEANNSWLTYEEAELECLKKLIEIVKDSNSKCTDVSVCVSDIRKKIFSN